MNVLALGGTRFVGRHIAGELTRGGHRVVCFHRGVTKCELPQNVEERFGDRSVDLNTVSGEYWDAILDVNCYEPEQMRRSVELRANWYLMISSVNVYSDLSIRGVSENAATMESFDSDDPSLQYGGKKAACERLLLERYPQRSTILRPGLIVGKWDYTGRFAYWCGRMLRGGRVLAPGPCDRLIQFIDAADLARFAERAVANQIHGIFNVVGPAKPTTIETLLNDSASAAAERGAPDSTIAWADEAFLLENNVQPWTEMPLWLPDAQWRGVLEINNAKALAAGLNLRPIRETVRSVMDWLPANEIPQNIGTSPARESELLARYDALRTTAFTESRSIR